MANNNIDNTKKAISILQDTSYQELEREKAVTYLKVHPSAAGIKALVLGLGDDDYGVHWACGTAVAYLGEDAFHVYLEALAKADHSQRLREIARHLIHNNSSDKVRQDGQALLAAVKGPTAALATIEEANKLLVKYH